MTHIPYTLFAVFDGHAGAGCAVAASNDLWQIIHAKLENVGPQLLNEGKDTYDTIWPTNRPISTESLVIGALETAFWEADQLIGEEKKMYHMLGGCTVLVALFILGRKINNGNNLFLCFLYFSHLCEKIFIKRYIPPPSDILHTV